MIRPPSELAFYPSSQIYLLRSLFPSYCLVYLPVYLPVFSPGGLGRGDHDEELFLGVGGGKLLKL